jgi:ABC-type transport system substrate-binding protein
MKNKMLLTVMVSGLLACAACSSTAPANANKATNTTTTTTTTTNTSNTSAPANTNSSTTSNTNTTSNSGSTAQQGANQDFTLVNKTGVEIDKVFISPHDVDSWQEDILGQDTLPDGQSVDIKFNRSEKAPKWDLRIEDSKGNAIEWENLNLLEISKVTLFYKDGKGTAEVE